MKLTHINCCFWVPQNREALSSSIAMFNPGIVPGRVVVTGASAIRASIGSHVASTLALEHFIDCVHNAFEKDIEVAKKEGEKGEERSSKILEEAYRSTNSSVYEFGHKLAAGGRLAASLMALVIDGNAIAAARSGDGSVYLYRSGELFPFFLSKKGKVTSDAVRDDLIGSNSVVSVELATVPLAGGDIVFLFSRELERELEGRLISLGEVLTHSPDNIEEELKSYVQSRAEPFEFAAAAQLGPQVHYLS